MRGVPSIAVYNCEISCGNPQSCSSRATVRLPSKFPLNTSLLQLFKLLFCMVDLCPLLQLILRTCDINICYKILFCWGKFQRFTKYQNVKITVISPNKGDTKVNQKKNFSAKGRNRNVDITRKISQLTANGRHFNCSERPLSLRRHVGWSWSTSGNHFPLPSLELEQQRDLIFMNFFWSS